MEKSQAKFKHEQMVLKRRLQRKKQGLPETPDSVKEKTKNS